MFNPACLWIRSRLEPYADGALGPRLTRAIGAHLGHCPGCLARVEGHLQLRTFVKSAALDPQEPDWTGFWPGIQAGLRRGEPRPLRDPWWVPLWRPFWGHPRLALGGVMAAALAGVLSLWPGGDSQIPAAWAGPVVVQDVGTPDPDRTVMVYSTPDHALTVIWLFPPDTEES
jgi:anti-sigma factor RsiW